MFYEVLVAKIVVTLSNELSEGGGPDPHEETPDLRRLFLT